MASEQDENPREEGSSPAIGWVGTLQDQYRKIRENAEAYPYVWASYILVYGGFALWTTYRFRKLRRTEDRVRVLQERLRKIVVTEESASSASAVSIEKSLPSGSSPVEKSDPAVNDITKNYRDTNRRNKFSVVDEGIISPGS